MMPVYKVHEYFQIGVADGDFGRADVDLVVLNTGFGSFGDNIGVVDADEFVGGQLVFEGMRMSTKRRSARLVLSDSRAWMGLSLTAMS
jgi:hypothetical protein